MINTFTDTRDPASLILVRGPFTTIIHFERLKMGPSYLVVPGRSSPHQPYMSGGTCRL